MNIVLKLGWVNLSQNATSQVLLSALRQLGLDGEEDTSAFWSLEVPGESGEAIDYIQYCSSVEVNRSVVFYETMAGDRMNDSPLAIFDYLRSHPEYGSYLHVWSVSDETTVPEKYRNQDDTVFVSRGTRAYSYFLACAGRLISNAALPSFFRRRRTQAYLNTWHGIPFKKIGRDLARTKYGGPAGATSSFIKATHLISPCNYFTTSIASAYSLEGVSGVKVAETGCPRVDITLNTGAVRQREIREAVALDNTREASDQKPVVLYAPTWRWDEESAGVDQSRIALDLDALSSLDIDLLYRGHHKTATIVPDEAIGGESQSVFIPPLDLNTNELLSIVDILVTDYSSVFFDMLPTGRPVIHYLHSLEEYSESQGLYLDPSELPGSVAYDRNELVRSVADATSHMRATWPKRDFSQDPLQGESYLRARARFCPHEDGASTRRAVEFFFRDQIAEADIKRFIDRRPSTAYWAGALGNSLESEGFLAHAVKHSDTTEHQSATIFHNHTSHVSKWSVSQMESLRNQGATVPLRRVQPILLTTEEGAYSEFVSRNALGIEDVAALIFESDTLREVFSREYSRHLDEKRFTEVHLAPHLSNYDLGLAVFALDLGASISPNSSHFAHLSPAEFASLCAEQVTALDADEMRVLSLSTKLDQARSRSRRLAERIATQQDRLDHQRARIERQKLKISTLKSRIATFESRIANLRSRLTQLERSLTWKFTAPLRAARGRLRK